MSEEQSAFNQLLTLAQKSRQSAQQLPEQLDIVSEWTGVGFSLLGVNLVIPMNAISEMIEVPTYTKLPGVQSWVRGIASVRGRLLPVFDLANYFGKDLRSARKQQRLLVIETDHIYAGLQVDRVYGVMHFPVDTQTFEVEASLPEELLPHIVGAFVTGGRTWFTFDIGAIIQQDKFMDIAL